MITTYTERGWKVFPLTKNTKTPATRNGFKDASTDPHTIKAGQNVGIATGNGLLVLDIDRKHGKDGGEVLASLEREHGKLPATLTATTPSGGEHLYFSYPANVAIQSRANICKEHGEGLDIRADGGYIVAPPSRTEASADPKGKTATGDYTWLNALPVSELPSAWLELLRAKERTRNAPEPRTYTPDSERMAELQDAMAYIPAGDYDTWVSVGKALYSLGDSGFELWDTWSRNSDKYDGREMPRRWQSLGSGVAFTPAFIYSKAQSGGWQNPAKKPHTRTKYKRPAPEPHKAHTLTQRLAVESKRYDHTIVINQRYLADAVQKAFDAGHNHLVVLSDMGSGKSYMLIDHIQRQAPNEVTLVITPLASLCQGNANRYACAGIDAVNYTELKEETAKTCRVVTTTYNTLPSVEKMLLAAGRVINIVAVDESEAGAQFLASGTITNKSEAGESLRKLIGLSKHSVLMDAHCDLGTYLLGSVFTDQSYTLLANTNKAWSGHTYSWHEGRDAAVSLVIDLIDSGKKAFITATTAGQAKKLHMALERAGVLAGLRVLAAYPSDDDKYSEALRDAKDNQEMFKTYDVVIASPTVGVGISIDGEWFDSVVSLFIRDKDAPSALGAMQMPFRVRNIGDKHIHLVRVDQIERGRKLAEWQIMQDKKAYDGMLSVMDAHSFDDAEKSKLFGQLARLHGGFESRLDVHESQMFDDYYSLIDREFSDKGIRLVTACPIAEMDNPYAGLNKAIKEKRIADIIAAPIISSAECADIESRAKYQPRTVTASEKMAVQKHHVIAAYHATPETPPTDVELLAYLAQADKEIATGRNNMARATLTTPEINRLQKHYRSGRDAADKRGAFVKEQWRLDRVLLDIAGVGVGDMGGYSITDKRVIDDGLLTTKEKGRSATQQLIELAASYNATKPDARISIKQVKENPCKIAKKLIEIRLKLICKYCVGKKEREATGDYSFTVEKEQPVLDNLNMMIETRGVFGDLRVLAQLSAEDAVSKMDVDFEVAAHIKRNLSKIPHKQHAEVMAEYLRRAALPRADGDNMTSQAAANVWLHDRANGAKSSE